MDFTKRLRNYAKAAMPGLIVKTVEEARAMGDIYKVSEGLFAKDNTHSVWVWSCTTGLVQQRLLPEGVATLQKVAKTEDLMDCLVAAQEMIYNASIGYVPEPAGKVSVTQPKAPPARPQMREAFLVLRDPHKFPLDKHPMLARLLRDVLTIGPSQGVTVILLAPELQPDQTVERMLTILDYELPNDAGLRELAEQSRQDGLDAGVAPEAVEVTEAVIRALSGLSSAEAANALSLSIIERKGFDPKVIYREKVSAVQRSGLLEIVEADPRGLDAIGGLDVLKGWISQRRLAFTPKAAEYGLPSPKGLLLVGPPGSGKSLAAKCIGTALGVPTLKLDISNLFGSHVGESERKTKDTLDLAERLAPCVLMCDEIDKGFAGSTGSGEGDSGVSKRVFGAILTWMQERKRSVFLIASANNVQHLPPELLRKGRFDELFAVDVPNARDRAAIYKIQLAKYGRDPADFDCAAAAAASTDFTGSEIEAVVIEALYAGFDDGMRQITTADLTYAASHQVPLAQTAREPIEAMRAWAASRARYAASPDVEPEEVPAADPAPRSNRRLLA